MLTWMANALSRIQLEAVVFLKVAEVATPRSKLAVLAKMLDAVHSSSSIKCQACGRPCLSPGIERDTKPSIHKNERKKERKKKHHLPHATITAQVNLQPI